MGKKITSSDSKLLNARIQAAIKLQHLCFDAANQKPGAFMNRDRAQDVVDAIVVVVLETLSAYANEEDTDAAANAK